MTAPAPPPSLRPTASADAEFLYRVYAHTRYEELAPTGWPPAQVEAFLRMQFRAQDADYHANYPDATFDVIMVGGEPAGRLYVHRRPDEVAVLDIALLPEFRRAGVGTFLLTRLLDEAAATRLPVRIHVETFNPARRLYDRLGFVPVGENGVYVEMERRPPG